MLRPPKQDMNIFIILLRCEEVVNQLVALFNNLSQKNFFTNGGKSATLYWRSKIAYAPVAQLDRVTDSDSVGHWFESSRAYQKVTVSRLLTVTFIFCFARALVINAVRKHSTTLRIHSHQFDPIFHCIQV